MNLADVIEGRFLTQSLSTNIVHYVVVSTAATQGDAIRLRTVMDAEELAKADRYRFEKDKLAFTVCRGALRMILAKYTNTAPQAVKFSYGRHGKPQLAGLGIKQFARRGFALQRVALGRNCVAGGDSGARNWRGCGSDAATARFFVAGADIVFADRARFNREDADRQASQGILRILVVQGSVHQGG